MTKKYGTKCITVIDGGIFVNHALTLAKDFGKVNYWTPWNGPFPKSNFTLPGYGFPEINRVNNLFDVIDETDIFYSSEVMGMWDLEIFLESLGKPVFGARRGEEMETDRAAFKEHMKKLGMPVGGYEKITGLDNLRKYLKEHENVWVKLDLYRGDGETWHSENYKLSEPMLDELEWKLGAKKYIYTWVVDDALDDKVEIASDFWTVDGKYPKRYLCGVEVKDLGYIGIIGEDKTLPPEITVFNDKMADTFKSYGYRGFFGTEFRVGKDHKSYMLDFCARPGSPPSELFFLMYKNLADIIWEGAHGNIVEPITTKKWGVEALIHSAWAPKNWQAIYFPDSIKENVTLRNCCMIEGKTYVVPQVCEVPEIGAIRAEDDTLEGAVDQLKAIAEQVKGYCLEIHVKSIDTAFEYMDKLEEYGVKLFPKR
jgi:hypothetical protein